VIQCANSFFHLWHRLHLTEHLRGRCLVETNARIDHADGLEQRQCTDTGNLRGGHGLIERHTDEALGSEIVDLVGLRAFEKPDAGSRVRQVVFDQRELRMVVYPQLLDAPEIDGAGSPVGPENAITLVEQQLRQVRPILTGDSSHHRSFHQLIPCSPGGRTISNSGH
jgi:hypothetical protein